MGWDHRSVEGALYGLGRPADTPSTRSPVIRPSAQPHAPHDLPRQSQRRVDLHFAVTKNLTPEEVSMVRDHYIRGTRRVPYAQRKQVIQKIIGALTTAQGLTGDRSEE